eukprot:9985402-Alexandrium_andersonii.AAC.1
MQLFAEVTGQRCPKNSTAIQRALGIKAVLEACQSACCRSARAASCEEVSKLCLHVAPVQHSWQ